MTRDPRHDLAWAARQFLANERMTHHLNELRDSFGKMAASAATVAQALQSFAAVFATPEMKRALRQIRRQERYRRRYIRGPR